LKNDGHGNALVSHAIQGNIYPPVI
jgi:hypothetical protein